MPFIDKLIHINKKNIFHHKTDNGYSFLQEIKIQSQKDLLKNDCLIFSFFKFGVKKILDFYVKNLVLIIRNNIGKNLNSSEWVVVSRANLIHSYLSGSISEALSKNVAKKLNLPHVISYAHINMNKNYSKINSIKERKLEISKRKYLFLNNKILKNKHVIFVDDIINSGLTIQTIQQSLKKYKIKSFNVFTVAKLTSSKLNFEFKLSHAIFMNRQKEKNIKYIKKLFLNSELILTNKFLKLICKNIN
jgi:hypoxanthine-guanine phosphoribosyltransferase